MTAGTDRLVGVVVAGTGWGALSHVPALQRTGFEVKALVGTDLARTAARAEASGIPHATTDYAEALALPGVDAVVIATPPSTHAELTLAAIGRHKHVLCEKPFATSVEDAIRMRVAAEDVGVVHMVGYEMRWLPHQATMAMALRDNAVGKPTFATHLKLNGVLAARDASVPDWFGRRDSFGGWMNAEIQHVVDEVRTALGEFARVTAAETSAASHDWNAPESFVVHFELTSGLIGMIQSSIGTFGPPVSTVRVSGTEGTIWLTAENEVMRTAGSAASERIPPPTWLSEGDELRASAGVHGTSTLSRALTAASTRFSRPTQHLATAFRQRILGSGQDPVWPPLPIFADGVRNTIVHDAVRTSVATGKTCEVPDVLGAS
jgi:predicted dehydrogenase